MMVLLISGIIAFITYASTSNIAKTSYAFVGTAFVTAAFATASFAAAAAEYNQLIAFNASTLYGAMNNTTIHTMPKVKIIA